MINDFRKSQISASNMSKDESMDQFLFRTQSVVSSHLFESDRRIKLIKSHFKRNVSNREMRPVLLKERNTDEIKALPMSPEFGDMLNSSRSKSEKRNQWIQLSSSEQMLVNGLNLLKDGNTYSRIEPVRCKRRKRKQRRWCQCNKTLFKCTNRRRAIIGMGYAMFGLLVMLFLMSLQFYKSMIEINPCIIINKVNLS